MKTIKIFLHLDLERSYTGIQFVDGDTFNYEPHKLHKIISNAQKYHHCVTLRQVEITQFVIIHDQLDVNTEELNNHLQTINY